MAQTPRRRTAILLIGVSAIVALFAYGYALWRRSDRVLVQIENRTGGPLEDVRIEKDSAAETIATIADGSDASVGFSFTKSSAVTVSFRGADGKLRSAVYHHQEPHGINNELRIVLFTSLPERRQMARSTLIVGTEATYEDSISRIDEESRERPKGPEAAPPRG